MRWSTRLIAAALLAGGLVMLTRTWLDTLYLENVALPPLEGRDLPLIFVGGVPRSGTTLMRVMFDAHPLVRCGQETRIIPQLLSMHSNELKSKKESARLEEAGVTKTVFDSAVAAFCLQIIVGHGDSAPRLCTKDPYILSHATYVHELFPNAKFVFMVRDGRASAHSIITRNISIPYYNLNSYRTCLEMWNTDVKHMYNECLKLGRDYCLAVRYETLVLQPETTVRKILQWLDLPWNESVLHHDRYILQPNGAALSFTERSTDQVVRPVNLDALDKWVGNIPKDVVAEMDKVAPMLKKLGYDPHNNLPDYRTLPQLDVHAD